MKNCDLDLSSIILEVINAPKGCIYKSGDKFKLTEIIPPDECLFALHEVAPYYLTLKNNGYFKWEKDKNTVMTQCPNTDVAVGVRVRCSETNKIYAKVASMGSKQCPKNYKKGDEILSSVIDNNHLCLTALDVLFPYILFLESCSRRKKNASPITVQCSYSNKPAKFRLSLKKNFHD